MDGIPIEFYKSYYGYTKNDLQQLYNLILFRNDNLTPSMNQVIINLLHKNDKKENLKNLEANLSTMLRLENLN